MVQVLSKFLDLLLIFQLDLVQIICYVLWYAAMQVSSIFFLVLLAAWCCIQWRLPMPRDYSKTDHAKNLAC